MEWDDIYIYISVQVVWTGFLRGFSVLLFLSQGGGRCLAWGVVQINSVKKRLQKDWTRCLWLRRRRGLLVAVARDAKEGRRKNARRVLNERQMDWSVEMLIRFWGGGRRWRRQSVYRPCCIYMFMRFEADGEETIGNDDNSTCTGDF